MKLNKVAIGISSALMTVTFWWAFLDFPEVGSGRMCSWVFATSERTPSEMLFRFLVGSVPALVLLLGISAFARRVKLTKAGWGALMVGLVFTGVWAAPRAMDCGNVLLTVAYLVVAAEVLIGLVTSVALAFAVAMATGGRRDRVEEAE